MDKELKKILETFDYKLQMEGTSYALLHYFPSELVNSEDEDVADLHEAAANAADALRTFNEAWEKVKEKYGIDEEM